MFLTYPQASRTKMNAVDKSTNFDHSKILHEPINFINLQTWFGMTWLKYSILGPFHCENHNFTP